MDHLDLTSFARQCRNNGFTKIGIPKASRLS